MKTESVMEQHSGANRKRGNNKVTTGDLMSRDVQTCHPSDSLHVAAGLMWNHDCGCVPVCQDDRVVGMLTDRDVCMAAYTQGKPLEQLTAADAMSRALYSCQPDDPASAAKEIMAARQVRRLPVIEGEGRLVGLVSLCDLAREAAPTFKQRTRAVTTAEVGETLSAICDRERKAAKAPAA